MKELQKDILSYEGYYMVSNFGNVKSLDRIIKNNGTDVVVYGKLKSPKDNGNGYKQVELYKNGKGKKFYIHRLVSTHFIGFNMLDVNHKDGIKSNNYPDNLEFMTELENFNHAIKNNLIKRDEAGRFIKKIRR